ncbi:class I SAM-dependent methyltransferase [Fodinicola feengrottensis]|uniref:class I SAM-dependent methyltransferase n=1 Tax=Fodinicola feengrottensis TaxID=435914 RepID=UPI0013D49FF0|nr:class I SAM-dependent methyltransferase [Fodinicola feengrottensis]
MDRQGWDRRRLSFGAVAQLYQRTRPDYPAEAVKWMLATVPAGGTVLDLGAGTGKLTRVLAGLGFEVVAVEPSTPMREALAAALPGTRVLEGGPRRASRWTTARWTRWSLGRLTTGSTRTSPTRDGPGRRVLRPGGALGLIWNLLDERTSWIAQLGSELDAYDRTSNGFNGNGFNGAGSERDLGPWFNVPEHERFHHQQRLTITDLLDLLRSRSTVATLDTPQRDALLGRVQTLVLRNAPVDAQQQQLDLPYIASTYRSTRT